MWLSLLEPRGVKAQLLPGHGCAGAALLQQLILRGQRAAAHRQVCQETATWTTAIVFTGAFVHLCTASVPLGRSYLC